ncbi:MAG: YkgJ family cysteine cluster protein [Acidimicrobiia bacterium]
MSGRSPLTDWLTALDDALAGAGSLDVPCGTCVACCSSWQFVHIEPDETATLAAIPRALRFAAPGLPAGHVVLPHDDRGRCPMLGPHGCTIYAVRPRTCRAYDCRVFPATGLTSLLATEPDKAAIAARAAEWEAPHGDHGDDGEDGARADDTERATLRRAGAYLRDHPEVFTDAGRHPPAATGLAILAVRARRAFASDRPPTPEEVRAELQRP